MATIESLEKINVWRMDSDLRHHALYTAYASLDLEQIMPLFQAQVHSRLITRWP